MLGYRAAISFLVSAWVVPAMASAHTTITVEPSQVGPTISATIRGANMAQWFDPTKPNIAASLVSHGFTAVRWPGGNQADQAHWQTNTLCGSSGTITPKATFDNFMNYVVLPGKLDLDITLNYGSNAACTDGGDASEAAAWVSYAKSHNYPVSHWTVGNENYGGWEYDLHSSPHDPTTYAAAVTNDYYPQIKAADSTAQVGIVVQPNTDNAVNHNWDPIVLANAPYDFVEMQWYAQSPGKESDAGLLGTSPGILQGFVNTLKSELATAGHPNTPIVVDELGTVYGDPGKQTTSIVQALYVGEVLSELVADGISRMTWWIAFGGCGDATKGNFSSSLYGWQTFSGYALFSDGLPEKTCPNAPVLPLGTPLPSVWPFQLLATAAPGGESVLGTTQSGNTAGLTVLAATHGTGFGFYFVNTNKTETMPLSLVVPGLGKASSVTIDTYGKAQYDLSKNSNWVGPTHRTLKKQKLPLSLTLPVYSITSVVIAP